MDLGPTRRRSRSISIRRTIRNFRRNRRGPGSGAALFPCRRRVRHGRENDVGLRHAVQRRDLRRRPIATSAAPGFKPCSTTSIDCSSNVWTKKSATSEPFSFSPTPSRRAVSSSTTSRTAGSGCGFKRRPRGEPSEIIIHVRMLDEANVDQQEALGDHRRQPDLRRVLLSSAGETDRHRCTKTSRPRRHRRWT